VAVISGTIVAAALGLMSFPHAAMLGLLMAVFMAITGIITPQVYIV
jgi:hypothetical protein